MCLIRGYFFRIRRPALIMDYNSSVAQVPEVVDVEHLLRSCNAVEQT